MASVRFFPLDITYKVVEGKAQIHLFGRIDDGQRVCLIDRSFEPYFWVLVKGSIEAFRDKVAKLRLEGKDEPRFVTKAEIVKRRLMGEDKEFVKVYANLPGSVPALRDELKTWDEVEGVYEADILFTRRYLIDKSITPMVAIEAYTEPATGFNYKVPTFYASQITVADETVSDLNVMAFDIETYAPVGSSVIMPDINPILMIGVYTSKGFKKVITSKRFETKLPYVEFVNSESEIIERFKEIIEDEKPEILVGYNSDGFDFPYIRHRAERYKIKLDIGLDGSVAESRRGADFLVRGIPHIDVYQLVRRIVGRSLRTDSYSLGLVAQELIGEAKVDVEIDKLADTWDNHPEQLDTYCEYNLHDARLAYNLFDKLLPMLEELVKIIGLPLFDASRMGFSQLVEWYLLRQAPVFKEVAPNKPGHEQVEGRRQSSYTGGFVYEPSPGRYKNIMVFDFMSLYPTIISSHNICPSTLNCECCVEDEHVPNVDKYWFCHDKPGFISMQVEDLITRRVRVKGLLAKKPSEILKARSQSLKLLANSFYGYLGFFGARWYSLECAESVTAYGRYYIQKVIKEAENAGFKVIYSDTDSVFLTYEDKSKDEAMTFAENVNKELPGLMELEFEEIYPAGIFVSTKDKAGGAKKRYALLRSDGTLKIRGFEAVRRNWSVIGKEVQEQVLNDILRDDDPKKAFSYVKDVIEQLRKKEVPVEKLVIKTQLQRETKSYATIGPHVAVAMRLEDKGVVVRPGQIIQYVITEGKGVLRDRARLPDEVTSSSYDAGYYIEGQVIPSVERMLNVFGYTKDDLLGEHKQQKLDEFFG